MGKRGPKLYQADWPQIEWDYNLISLADAQSLRGDFIYGLYSDDHLIYIGQTINPMNRFYCYTNVKYCHNKNLSELLNTKKCKVSLFKSKKCDMDKIETELISRFKDSIVNIHGGGEMNWKQDSKPWQAKRGVLCPSSYIMRELGKKLGSDNKDHIQHKKDVSIDKKEMSAIERCKYEIAVSMKFYHLPRFKKGIDRWLSCCGQSIYDIIKSDLADAKQ